VAPLVLRVRETAARLAEDVAAADPRASLRGVLPAGFAGPDRELDQGAALLHVYEELAQHHGQMEILRDSILAEFAPAPGVTG